MHQDKASPLTPLQKQDYVRASRKPLASTLPVLVGPINGIRTIRPYQELLQLPIRLTEQPRISMGTIKSKSQVWEFVPNVRRPLPYPTRANLRLHETMPLT